VDPASPVPSPREPNGRFATGNPGGPGGSRRKACELRRAAEEAVTPEIMNAAMRKCAMLALQGNLAAMRILLDRVLGRPAEAPTDEPLDIAAPKLRTAADCSAALQRVSDAMCAGRLDAAAGKALVDLISTQAKLLEVSELAARIEELEKMAGTVELPGRR
jgi:hypothetical protein